MKQQSLFDVLNKPNQKLKPYFNGLGEPLPWEDEKFQFTLKGNAHLVWVFDQGTLESDLAGKSKGAFETILSGYPSIDEAEIVLRPFWRQTFPEKSEDIKVATVIKE